MKYESSILKRLIDTYGVIGNPRYLSEIIKEFIVQGKECYPNLFTYQSDWLAHIDEFGLTPEYTVSYTGQQIYAPNTKERPVKRAILSGNTEVIIGKNLFNGNLENGAYSQFTGVKEEAADSLRSVDFIKVEPSSTICCSNNGIARATHIFEYDENKKFLKFNNAITKLILSSSTKYITFYGGNSDRDKMQIEYGEEPTYYEEYKQTLTSVKMPVLTTTGKNLCNINNYIHGGLSNNNSIIFSKDQYRSYFMKCKPSTTYAITVKNSNNRFGVGTSHLFSEDTTFPVNTYWVTSSSDVTGQTLQYTVTTTEKDKYLYVYTANNGVFNPDIRVQVEEAMSATSYEPFKSNILSTPSDLELRGIGEGSNRVEDELNVMTGKVIERIGGDDC